MIDSLKLMHLINLHWENSIFHTLCSFIKIPCKSPDFDPNWESNGKLAEATNLVGNWAKLQGIPGIQTETIFLEKRSPLLYIEIPATSAGVSDTVLFYGHLDKMPEAEGWREGLTAWNPVLEGDWLYGRGAADNGYAAFSYIAAIKALHDMKLPYPRCVMILECSEEGGSRDIAAYLDHLADRIGQPSLAICLDSGSNDYDRIWLTNSARGHVTGMLQIEVLKEAVHSGSGGGAVPSPFLILRQLLSKVENEATGEILISDLHTQIPESIRKQIKDATQILGSRKHSLFPLVGGCKLLSDNLEEIVLNTTWKPALALLGTCGIPAIESAANAILPSITIYLSVRIPPGVDPNKSLQKLKEIFETNTPYNARITFTPRTNAPGWKTPDFGPQLEETIQQASKKYFGNPSIYIGMGGTISLFALLMQRFPNAELFMSGILGPNSNAHGPNEALYIPATKKMICCITEILAAHAQRK